MNSIKYTEPPQESRRSPPSRLPRPEARRTANCPGFLVLRGEAGNHGIRSDEAIVAAMQVGPSANGADKRLHHLNIAQALVGSLERDEVVLDRAG